MRKNKHKVACVAIRGKTGLNQQQFWNAINVTQSGGSRYETGRKLPGPVALLLVIAYGTKAEALKIINRMREYNQDK